MRRTTILPKVRELWRLSERRACAVLDINRKMLWYQPVKRDDPVLRARIKEIAWQRVRYGHKRIAVLLRREGWIVNLKRVRRIYREENLSIRTKTPKRRRAAVVRQERVVPTAPNQSWAMDFMNDVLADGAKIGLLTIVDSFSRESLALEVAVWVQVDRRRRGASPPRYRAWNAAAHPLRQRPRIRISATGSVGLLESRKARFLASRTPVR